MNDDFQTPIDLAVGDPAGAPPGRLQSVLREAIGHPSANHYTFPSGLRDTRAAVAGYYRRRHGLTVDPDSVAITHGARPALYFGLRAANRPGRAVGYFAPAYTAFASLVADAGMTPIPIPLPDQRLTRELLAALLSVAKSGMFILNNPQNPTGRVFDAEEVRALCDVARTHDIRLISDFVYADLYEDDPPTSILTEDSTAVEITSLSKPFRACGWRVGAAVGDPGWVREIVRRYATLNGVPFAFQRVAAVAWSEMPEVEEFRTEVMHRRRILANGLRRVGFSLATEAQNRSGLFVWAEVPKHWPSARALKQRLAAFGVLVSDGADFGGDSARHLRFALNEPGDVLSTALSRIKHAMEAYDDAQETRFPARRADGRAA